MNRGFTLVELQTAAFIGILLIAAGSSLLNYQSKHLQLARLESQFAQEATRFDSTLQTLLLEAERLEISSQRLIIHTDRDIWLFDQTGCQRNLKPVPNFFENVQFSDFKKAPGRLNCTLTITTMDEEQRSYHFTYSLQARGAGL
jgi:hypothetical protein